jgi:murein DD-endopeptidase MepM/ murein hydrolase activator NlpD
LSFLNRKFPILFLSFILLACESQRPQEVTSPSTTPTPDGLGTHIAEQGQPTAVPTEIYTSSPTTSPTSTSTETPTATATFTETSSPTATFTSTSSPTFTATATVPATSTPQSSPTLLPTQTVEALMIAAATGTLTGSSIAGVATGLPTHVPSAIPLPAHPSPTVFTVGVPTTVATLPPGVFPTNTPRFSPTPTTVPGDHFWFWRPFERDSSGLVSDAPARGYAYGSSAGGGLPVHHGIDIQNGAGTSIHAIGSGTVFYAGPDLQLTFGPQPDFYGNVIVIEHDFLAPNGQPLFSLYGHLSRVGVATGDRVEYGAVIGAVGSEGVALGPHLHLEMRIGDPFDYYSTYNPELWTRPWENYGVLAARVTGPDGEPVPGARIELIGRGSYMSGWTYEGDTLNSDPYFQENFVLGDLRAGQYDLKVGEIRNIVYRDVVTIEPGIVTFIDIQLSELPQ